MGEELRSPPRRLETPADGYNAGVGVTDHLECGGGHVCVSLTGGHELSVNGGIDHDIPRSLEPQPNTSM